MKPVLFLIAVIPLLFPLPSAAGTGAERQAAYLERAAQILEEVADQVDPSDPESGGRGQIVASLALGKNIEWASQRLVRDLEEPRGDMFWMIPMTSIAYHGRDKLSGEALAALRHAWKTYMPQRGDTENHWAMYYTTLYLMSQYWPDLPGSEWYTGKSSAENMKEAREYILHWMEITTTIGQGEYDCTHYIGEYLMPMFMLASWADDPEMRIRGRMMIDYILADFAVDSLNGLYVGAHARTDDTAVLEQHKVLSTMFAWLFFGNTPRTSISWSLYVAANAPHYTVPEVIHRIATDKGEPYLSRELKRTRWRWRNAADITARVYKTTYVHKDYAIGSDQGGLLQPIQQHSWDLTWAVPDPRGVRNTIFSLNPHYSDLELQMYFTEFAYFMPDAVTRQGKPSYTSPETFLGGSPYEQVFQHENVIIALYDIPEGANHEHINGFFSKDLERIEEDESGWIFAQGGNTFIAYRPLAPYEWREMESGDKRLYSPHRLNGTILQPAAAAEYESFAEFRKAVLALPLKTSMTESPSVHFETLGGDVMELTYGSTPKVNGKALDYENWPLFRSRYLEAEEGSGILHLRHGRLERILDFNKPSITDRVHGQADQED